MKTYKKLMKELMKTKLFYLKKTTRKSTIKIVHEKSGEIYSIHPGDKAVHPLRKWAEKYIKK